MTLMASSNDVAIASVVVTGLLGFASFGYSAWADRRRVRFERAQHDLGDARQLLDDATTALMALRQALERIGESTVAGSPISPASIVPLRERLFRAQGLLAVLEYRFASGEAVTSSYKAALEPLAAPAEAYSSESVSRQMSGSEELDAEAVTRLASGFDAEAAKRAFEAFIDTARTHAGLRTAP